MPAPEPAPETAPDDGLPPTAADGDAVVIRLPDPDHHATGVRLWQEVGLPAEQTRLARVPGGWELRLEHPPVPRLQYLLEVRHRDGSTELVRDPTNPVHVDGPFGAHSVVELAAYRTPGWLHAPRVDGAVAAVELPAPAAEQGLSAAVWSPADAGDGEPLPLLLAHDGPELDRYAGLTAYVAAGIAAGELPRLRVGLLGPGPRNQTYSADDRYARTLVQQVLPAVTAGYATTGPPLLTGASLGALAALHAAWRHPGCVAGLFLQSGSFFALPTDSQEIRFASFWRVAGFVDEVLTCRQPPLDVPTTMTVGSVEENLDANRVLAAHLRSVGADVELHEVADTHTWTAWRDAFHPHLTRLLRRTWRTQHAA